VWVVTVLRMRLAIEITHANARSEKRSCWRMALFLFSWYSKGVGQREIEARDIALVGHGV